MAILQNPKFKNIGFGLAEIYTDPVRLIETVNSIYGIGAEFPLYFTGALSKSCIRPLYFPSETGINKADGTHAYYSYALAELEVP